MTDNALVSPPVANAPTDLMLDSLSGDGYPLRDWLTSYPLLLVGLDPYTHESAWLLETGARILGHYSPADVRVGWLVAADDDGCRQFLGPWAEEFLTFADPEREAIKALGVQRLPSLIHIRSDAQTQVADGWDPQQWKTIAAGLTKILAWSNPGLPAPGDPTPYLGTPATGG